MSVKLVKIPNPLQPDINIFEEKKYIPGQKLHTYIQDLPLNDPEIKFVISINGKIIEKDYQSIDIKDGDHIAACAKTEGTVASLVASAVASFVVGGSVAFSTAIVYSLAYGVTFLATTFAIAYGMNMLISSLAPSVSSVSSSTSDSSTTEPAVEAVYGWGPLQQTRTEGTSIPYLFGTNKVAGHVLNQFVNVRNNKETLNMLLGICDHEIDSITDVRLNDQPYSYFKGISTYTNQLGTVSDTAISGFGWIVNQVNVGSKLEYNTARTQRTDGTAVECINVHITAPYGLYYVQDDGTRSSRTATFKIEYKLAADSTYTLSQTRTIKSNSTEAQRRVYTIDNLTPGQYDVKVTRTNTELTTHRGRNTIHFTAIQEVVKKELVYPGLAKYAVKALATDQLSGSVPNITCLATRNYVQVYDEDNSPSPAWVSKRATNPAWICYALLNEFAKVDKDNLIWDDFSTWGDYCDETVDGDYRFIINTVIYEGNFWDQVQKIANLGHAAIIRRGTRYGVFVDKDDDYTYHLFTMGNIIEDSFNIQYLPKKDRANIIEIEYTDVDRDYTRQVVTVHTPDYLSATEESKTANVVIEAGISQAQAIREGIFRLNSNLHLLRVVTFDAFVDSFGCVIGDIFYFQHETVNYEGSNTGGYIIDAGNDDGSGNPYVEIDQEVEIETGVSYKILVRIVNGSGEEEYVEKTINNSIGQASVLTLTSSWTDIPAPSDLFIFGTATTYKKKYRITSIDRKDDLTRTITGLEYIDEVYSDNSTYAITEPTWESYKQEAIQVQASEFLTYAHDGSYQSNLNVTWHNGYAPLSYSWAVWLENITDIDNWVDDPTLSGSSGSLSGGGGTLSGVLPDDWRVWTGGTCTGTRNSDESITIAASGSGVSFYQSTATTTTNDSEYILSFDVTAVTGTPAVKLCKSDGTKIFIDEEISATGLYHFSETEDDEDDKMVYFQISDGESITLSFVQASEEDAGPQKIAIAHENQYTIVQDFMVGDNYRITITSADEGPVNTGNNTVEIEIEGAQAEPADVTGFSGSWDAIKRQVHFTWTANAEIDVKEYVIVSGSTWDLNNTVATTPNAFGSIYIDEGVSETITYRIKALDTSGNYSTTEATTSVAIDTSDCALSQPGSFSVSSSSTIASDGNNIVTILATWNTDSESSDEFHHYELQLEELSTSVTSMFATTDNQYQWSVIPNTNYGVTIRAVDVSGNKTSWITQETLTTTKDSSAPDTPTWPTSNYAIGGFKVVGLNWDNNTEYDFSHYILERSTSATFASDITILGEIMASFTSDDQDLDVSTTYYYRIKAVDTSGNESGYSAIKSATTLQVGSTDIAADAIIASHIDVTNLAAINADMGTITAGKIQNTGGTTYLDLTNDEMSLGGTLEWDGTDLELTIGDTVDGDYCTISAGNISFYQYIASSHRLMKSLKRIESGTAENNTVTTLDGYWSTAPTIMISPANLQCYDNTNSTHDQTLELAANTIVETSTGSGQYKFTPVAKLVMTDGIETYVINETGTDQDTAQVYEPYTHTFNASWDNDLEETSTEETWVTTDRKEIIATIKAKGFAYGYYAGVHRYFGIDICVRLEYKTSSGWNNGTWSSYKLSEGDYQEWTITESDTSDIIGVRATVHYEEGGITDGVGNEYAGGSSSPEGTGDFLEVTVLLESYSIELDDAEVYATGTLKYLAIGQ